MNHESSDRSRRLGGRPFSGGSFLKNSAYGLGSLALSGLLDPSLFRQSARAADAVKPDGRWRGVVQPPHLPVKAKRVIHLCMAGGPSQFESFDYKPKLKELDGKPFPESFTKGQQLAQLQNKTLIARGPFCEFHKHGQSGQEISDLFPHIATLADEMCIVRSMITEQINHDPAHAFMNSGSIIKGRPSMGSWLLYGLGAETDDLPGFVVLTSAGAAGQQPVSARQWSAGFLPKQIPGDHVPVEGGRGPLHRHPAGRLTRRPAAERRGGQPAQRDARSTTGSTPRSRPGSPSTSWRSGCRPRVPELTDFASEPKSVLDLYGVKNPGDGSFASNCLMARRLAERGVRLVQLYHRGVGPPRRHRTGHADRRARGRPGVRRAGQGP